jgi:hypothetical protein
VHQCQRVLVRLDVALAITFNEPMRKRDITTQIAFPGALVGFDI